MIGMDRSQPLYVEPPERGPPHDVVHKIFKQAKQRNQDSHNPRDGRFNEEGLVRLRFTKIRPTGKKLTYLEHELENVKGPHRLPLNPKATGES